MKNTRQKLTKICASNQIFSSIVWAGVILACAFVMDGDNKNVGFILITGATVEFLRISAANKALKSCVSKKKIES